MLKERCRTFIIPYPLMTRKIDTISNINNTIFVIFLKYIFIKGIVLVFNNPRKLYIWDLHHNHITRILRPFIHAYIFIKNPIDIRNKLLVKTHCTNFKSSYKVEIYALLR